MSTTDSFIVAYGPNQLSFSHVKYEEVDMRVICFPFHTCNANIVSHSISERSSIYATHPLSLPIGTINRIEKQLFKHILAKVMQEKVGIDREWKKGMCNITEAKRGNGDGNISLTFLGSPIAPHGTSVPSYDSRIPNSLLLSTIYFIT